jgi:glycosyltransferase involved in cell wall biosynthesis
VGNTGWDHGPILNAIKPWAKRGDLFWLNNVPASELRVMYQHAAATVCPGFAEGFDYAGVEAMKCGAKVCASAIDVHQEIYREAARYFNPYSTQDAANTFGECVQEDAEKNIDIAKKARDVSDSYSARRISIFWGEFLNELRGRTKA